jgi:UDP-N-acetylglucosamine 2-epimerase (non-hydrolysing)
MIDTLLQFRPQAALTGTVQKLGLSRHKYALATLHRPSNVDTAQGLKIVINILETVGQDVPVIFPLHPRTASNLEKFGLMNHWNNIRGLQAIAPQGYLEFLDLLENTALVLTDSGGIQDETTFLQIPCLTLRTSTERPVTITTGTNELVSVHNTGLIRQKVQQILSGQWRSGAIPEFWDGQSARRIAEFLINTFHSGMNGQGFCLPEKKN